MTARSDRIVNDRVVVLTLLLRSRSQVCHTGFNISLNGQGQYGISRERAGSLLTEYKAAKPRLKMTSHSYKRKSRPILHKMPTVRQGILLLASEYSLFVVDQCVAP